MTGPPDIQIKLWTQWSAAGTDDHASRDLFQRGNKARTTMPVSTVRLMTR
ncbi:hypothetical protein [Paramicrobacterium fandaimingii]|nr:hypothetical protein [Microbacterium fandaimingii]